MAVRTWAALVGAVALLSGGCSGGGGNANLATVSGTVTQAGAPVDGAKVTFHATVETKGQREKYAALTDSSGKYLLVSNGKDPGIPPGLYKVTVTKQGFKDAKAGTSAIADDPGQLEAQMSAAGANAIKNNLPKEYENEATTKLSVTLEVGKNEGKNFDLK